MADGYTRPERSAGRRTRIGRRNARVRALLSVANREGIAALARDLKELDVEIFATEGTREFLTSEGVEVASVNDLTDSQPTIGGQVKTFHHAVYAGILARRDKPEQLAELAERYGHYFDWEGTARVAAEHGLRFPPLEAMAA